MSSSPVEASCYCGTNTHTITLATAGPAIQKIACHCNSCRHRTGAFWVYYLAIASPPPDLQQLTSYAYSQRSTKYFCKKCGSHMYCLDEEGWRVAPGVLT